MNVVMYSWIACRGLSKINVASSTGVSPSPKATMYAKYFARTSGAEVCASRVLMLPKAKLRVAAAISISRAAGTPGTAPVV